MIDRQPVPFDAPLDAYERQAAAVLARHATADAAILDVIHHRHPRFLDDKIPWLPKRPATEEIARAGFDIADARMTVARCYDFLDWEALEDYAAATGERGAVWRFESAVEAVIDGDAAALECLLADDPDLAHARSARKTHFDPSVHRATLLHYVAANGVEGYRQRTPKNAATIAAMLLDAGAEPDALADLYGTPCTTMSLLVSSSHPAAAGVQGTLVELLLDRGAAIEGAGQRKWGTPLLTALVFGQRDAADTLVGRGARTDDLVIAAGLGLVEQAVALLPQAGAEARHRALSLAAQLGRTAVVRLLLGAGEDPNRYNAEGFHAHSTPLHQAAWGGHLETVRALVEGGARLDLEDRIYKSTPPGWASYGGKTEIEAYLRTRV
jgi:hypothetical protein